MRKLNKEKKKYKENVNTRLCETPTFKSPWIRLDPKSKMPSVLLISISFYNLVKSKLNNEAKMNA